MLRACAPGVPAEENPGLVLGAILGIAATKGIGYVTPAQWQAQLDLLSDLKLITAKPKVEDVLDTSFLDKVLKDGKVIWPG